MNDHTQIKLSLLENSHAFIREAVAYALSAKGDARKWQFAILNLVQSFELSLKTLLFKIHPIFIFENVDTQKNTVNPIQALERLKNPTIGNISFSKDERFKIENAIKLRNLMTHSEFILKPEYAIAKFFEVFAFVVHFQARYLQQEIEMIISYDSWAELIEIKKSIEELAKKAKQRIAEENIHPEFILDCPSCGESTFVFQDDINTCYTCRHSEGVVECQKCGNFVFERLMHDFSGEIYSDDREDVTFNDYGYRYTKACFECIDEIREDIIRQREDDEYLDWEMDYKLHL